ncbi:hypothetical protein VTG60DRAFT_3516 [Thermothelomyces hinnuleus]
MARSSIDQLDANALGVVDLIRQQALSSSQELLNGSTETNPAMKDTATTTSASATEEARERSINLAACLIVMSVDAWSIANVAGIEVAFTDNLVDHLRLVEDDTRLLIFQHASFLEYHRSPGSIFPKGLVEETLRTLALLFPQAQFSNQHSAQGSRRKWFRELRLKYRDAEQTVIEPRLALCGAPRSEDRQIERFHYWRDRLVILKQTYDDATPKTLGQWWHDRRNGVQWYTFWVAVLVPVITTFLSAVQAVEGALQVYKAFTSPKLM